MKYKYLEFFSGQFDDWDWIDFKNGCGGGTNTHFNEIYTGHGDGDANGGCNKHGFDNMGTNF